MLWEILNIAIIACFVAAAFCLFSYLKKGVEVVWERQEEVATDVEGVRERQEKDAQDVEAYFNTLDTRIEKTFRRIVHLEECMNLTQADQKRLCDAHNELNKIVREHINHG